MDETRDVLTYEEKVMLEGDLSRCDTVHQLRAVVAVLISLLPTDYGDDE